MGPPRGQCSPPGESVLGVPGKGGRAAAGSGTPGLVGWHQEADGASRPPCSRFPGRGEGGGREECGFEECLTQSRNSTPLFFILGLGFQLGSGLPLFPSLSLPSLPWLPHCSGLLGTEGGLFPPPPQLRSCCGNQESPGFGGRRSWVQIPRSPPPSPGATSHPDRLCSVFRRTGEGPVTRVERARLWGRVRRSCSGSSQA